jgi:hypothetical protein
MGPCVRRDDVKIYKKDVDAWGRRRCVLKDVTARRMGGDTHQLYFVEMMGFAESASFERDAYAVFPQPRYTTGQAQSVLRYH